jgi:hypothetical protein
MGIRYTVLVSMALSLVLKGFIPVRRTWPLLSPMRSLNFHPRRFMLLYRMSDSLRTHSMESLVLFQV